MADLRNILLALSNEFQEQIKLINDFGFVLNSTSRIIDGQPVDLSVPKRLQQCLVQSEINLKMCCPSTSSSSSSSAAIEKTSPIVEPLPVETSTDSYSYSNYESEYDSTSVGCSKWGTEDKKPAAGSLLSAVTHYCSRCKRNYVKNCIENHRWAIVRRHYKTAPCRHCGKYFSQMFMVKHKCRQKSNYCRKSTKLNPTLNIVTTTEENVYSNPPSPPAPPPPISLTNVVVKEENVCANLNPNIRVVENNVVVLAAPSQLRRKKVDTNESFRAACNKITRLPLYQDSKFRFGRTNCPQCQKSVTFSYVLEHILMKHEGLTASKFNSLTRMCPFCNQNFRSFHSLSYHVMSNHVETYCE